MATLKKILVLLVILTLMEVTFSYSSTSWNDYGGGDVWYLDRHNLNCGYGKGMNYLRFQKSGSKIRFIFNCDYRGIIRGTERRLINSYTYIKDGRYVEKLTDQSMKCNDDEVIQQFRLYRSSRTGNHVRYEYTCVGAKNYGHRSMTTTRKKCHYNCENEDMDGLTINVAWRSYINELINTHQDYSWSRQYIGWKVYHYSRRDYNSVINSYKRPS